MVKAFFFDLDDTLYDYTTADILAKEAVREYCLQNLSISGAVYDRQLAKAYVVAEERIGRECAAVHNRLIRYQCMLEMLKKPLFPHAYKMYRLYWDTLMKQMTLEEGVSLVMKQLKEQGVYVGICTNMTAEIQYQKIEKLGITRWIDGVVTSEEAGVEKPDYRIFSLCREKAEVLPEDCVFIGDSLRHDIEGAKQAGMQVIWYHKAELSEEEQQKAQRTGKILRISHVEKRDEEGFLIQNYYETRIEYVENGHRQQATVKSVDEFQEGEEVRILKDNERGGQLRIVENEKSAVFGPWILIGAGILIISMPFVQKQYGDAYVSAILAALMFLTGAALCASYGKDKKRNTEEIKAVLTDVLKWQNGQKKKWSTPAASYYPILTYTLDGKERRMRSRYNSSSPVNYKKGKEITLYRDLESGRILERGPKLSMLTGGIILILISAIGAISTLDVLGIL